ncbi:hypothetical protein CFC21_096444 [Triticum aestivum]|uniref:Uncharacterized protein n=2 Tax=Triticum aestivum TaxID=4565 RepID=A0A9R1LS79_WHEAT|nr:uncharacterized protein LOC123151846 [Triticum aestivum]KAF7094098.1 hypothetical protein CFC21_096444 [Triticum aestivum]
MPRLTPADASLILDHVVGDASIPTAAANVLLAGLPFPDRPTPRLLRSLLLRRLATDPVSTAALDSLQLLASLPDPDPASPVSAAHLAVAAFLACSAPDFDAAARALFARPGGRARRAVDDEEGGDPALASSEALVVADQFEAAVGNAFSQEVLKGLFGDRAKAERRVRDLLAAEWAAIGPSRLELAAEQIVGDGAVETWRAADETVRAKYRILGGKEKTREILSKIEDRISTPQVHKVIHDLKLSCADLHNVVDDPLPAAKAAADKVLAARMDKAVHINDEEFNNQAANCSIAGPSAVNDQGDTLRKGTPSSLMDWNPTAQSLLWEDSLDPDGSRSQSHRPHLPSPRRIPVSPLQVAENKARRRRARRWSSVEEETLRKGVEQFGSSNWKDILIHNPDAFIGRTTVDLKDKWRNMMR